MSTPQNKNSIDRKRPIAYDGSTDELYKVKRYHLEAESGSRGTNSMNNAIIEQKSGNEVIGNNDIVGKNGSTLDSLNKNTSSPTETVAKDSNSTEGNGKEISAKEDDGKSENNFENDASKGADIIVLKGTEKTHLSPKLSEKGHVLSSDSASAELPQPNVVTAKTAASSLKDKGSSNKSSESDLDSTIQMADFGKSSIFIYPENSTPETISTDTNPIKQVISDPPVENTPQPNHFCTECLDVFPTKSLLQKHINMDLEKNRFKCLRCPKKFHYIHGLKLHLKTHLPGFLACLLCLNTYSSMEKFAAHMDYHRSNVLYQYSVCLNQLLSNSLERMKKQALLAAHACTKSPKTFFSKLLLDGHGKTHGIKINQEFISRQKEVSKTPETEASKNTGAEASKNTDTEALKNTDTEAFKNIDSRHNLTTQVVQTQLADSVCSEVCSVSGNRKEAGDTTNNTPKIISIDTPKIISIDTPKIISIDTPKIISIDTPKSISIDTPKSISSFTSQNPSSKILVQSKPGLVDPQSLESSFVPSPQTKKTPVLYRCPACPSLFPSKTLLRQHRKTHGLQSFLCSKCPNKFATLEVLKNHERRVHTVAALTFYQCSQCPQKFSTVIELSVHSRKHRELQEARELSDHLRTHGEMHAARELSDHSRTHEESKDSGELSDHSRTHGERQDAREFSDQSRTHRERQDSREFSDHSRTHEVRHEARDSASVQPSNGLVATKRDVFECPICSYNLSSGELFLEHMKVHLAVKGNRCFQCPAEFYTEQALADHSLKHANVVIQRNDSVGLVSSNSVPVSEDVSRVDLSNETITKDPLVKDVVSKPTFANEVVSYEVVPREVVPNELVSREVVTTEVVSRQNVPNEVPQNEIVSNQIIPTKQVTSNEIASKEVVSKEILSTEVDLNTIVPDSSVLKEVVPKEVVSKEVVSKEVVSKEVVPNTSVSKEVVPKEVVPKEVVSKNHIPKEILSKKVSSKDIISKNDLPYKHLPPKSFSIEKPQKCSICRDIFFTAANLKTHMQLHDGEKPPTPTPTYTVRFTFACNECQQRFPSQLALDGHMRIHTTGKIYQCHKCVERFKNKGALENHLRIHLSDSGSGTKSLPKVASSLITDKVTPSGEKNGRLRNLTCEICQKHFQSENSYKVHMQQHTVQACFPCVVCDEKLTSRQLLLSHLTTHMSDNDSCKICLRVFFTKLLFAEHMLTHPKPQNPTPEETAKFVEDIIFSYTGEIFRCKMCHFAFNSQLALSAHMFKHSESISLCSVCKTPCPSKQELAAHMETHAKRTHQCVLCLTEFNSESALKQHSKTHLNTKKTWLL